MSRNFFTRTEDKQAVIETGEKPEELTGRRPTKLIWKRLTSSQTPQNPIGVARKYERFLRGGELSYADAAREFEVSRPTICHYVALVRRLPSDFVEWLEAQDNPLVLSCFRECRLREITRIDNERTQRERLSELAREFLEGTPEIDSALAAIWNVARSDTPPWPAKELRSINLDD